MTEAEAKTKWCPMVRMYGDDWTTRLREADLKAIQYGDMEKATKCIGSACAMWRWSGWVKEEIVPQGATTNWVPTIHTQKPSEDAIHIGYCGLAGKP